MYVKQMIQDASKILFALQVYKLVVFSDRKLKFRVTSRFYESTNINIISINIIDGISSMYHKDLKCSILNLIYYCTIKYASMVLIGVNI